MTITAGTIVNNVRDLVPDPASTYGDAATDGGLFRAATLYRWLNSLVKRAARECGAVIFDWTAVRQIAYQPWYALDDTWLTISGAVSNQFPLDTVRLVEGDAIWPGTSQLVAQSLAGYLRRGGDHLEFGLFPAPDASDVQTTLAEAMTAAAPDPVRLTSTADFLSFGYFKVDNEIVQYQRLLTGPSRASVLSRGTCGTTAAVHANGATVTHLGLWCKGTRTPAPITASTSVIELPPDIVDLLEDALLARCRTSEQEFGEASRLMQQFDAACRAVRADPTRKESQGQVRAFGDTTLGPLYLGGRVIVP